MLCVEGWAELRRLAVAEEMPIKAIARQLGFEEYGEGQVWRRRATGG